MTGFTCSFKSSGWYGQNKRMYRENESAAKY